MLFIPKSETTNMKFFPTLCLVITVVALAYLSMLKRYERLQDRYTDLEAKYNFMYEQQREIVHASAVYEDRLALTEKRVGLLDGFK
jgi:hypothetical protein